MNSHSLGGGPSALTGREMSIMSHHIADILRIHTSLLGSQNYQPCQHINDLLESLVKICVKSLSSRIVAQILNDSRVVAIQQSLREICAEAEYHLEAHWASIIASGTDEQKTHDLLTSFPYFENYVELTKMELGAIRSASKAPLRRVAFIGSGPLPLTSLCLHAELNISQYSKLSSWLGLFPRVHSSVTNIDHDPDAILKSSVLCQKLGSKGLGMAFRCEEAEGTGEDLREFDVVYIAALVGSNQQEKEMLLKHVTDKMREGSILVVRTAHGLRTLLYPEFDCTTEAVTACLEICLVVHPYNHIVNSAIIAKVKKS